MKNNTEENNALIDNLDRIVYRCNDEDWTMKYNNNEIENISGYPDSDFVNIKFWTIAARRKVVMYIPK